MHHRTARRSFLGGLAAASLALGGAALAPAATAVGPSAAAPAAATAQDRAATVLAGMSQEEKIGQLLWTHVYGASADDATYAAQNQDVFGPDVTTPAQAVSKYHLGGVLYFNWSHNVTTSPTDLAQVAMLSDGLQEAARSNGAGVPLAITIDQEGGIVARVRTPGTEVPGNMALGATGSTDLAYEQGRVLGSELRALGINVDFAPDVDVNTNAANPVIGVRSLGDDESAVAALGAAQVEGIQSQGVSATAKHFPGHGDTSTDSHTGLPVVTYDRATLDRHLVPFRAAIDAGVDMIMTAHIIVEAIDPERPATISHKVLTDLLRGELGYTGLVTTDAMDMEGAQLSVMTEAERTRYAELKDKAVAAKAEAATDPTAQDSYTAATAELKSFLAPIRGRVAVEAFTAGSDILLNTYDAPAVVSAMTAAVEDGSISADRLDASVLRILTWKAERGVLDTAPTSAETIAATVGSAEHRATAAAIADASVTMTRNDADAVLPLDPAVQHRVLLTGSSWGNPELLEPAMSDLGFDVTRYATSGASSNPSAAEVDGAVAQAAELDPDAIVVTTYSMRPGSTQAALVDRLAALGKPLIVVTTRNPYDMNAMAGTVPAAQSGECVLAEAADGTRTGCTVRRASASGQPGTAVVNLYSNSSVSLGAAARVIAGQAPTGLLPVRIPTADGAATLLTTGYGLTYPSVVPAACNGLGHTKGKGQDKGRCSTTTNPGHTNSGAKG